VNAQLHTLQDKIKTENSKCHAVSNQNADKSKKINEAKLALQKLLQLKNKRDIEIGEKRRLRREKELELKEKQRVIFEMKQKFGKLNSLLNIPTII